MRCRAADTFQRRGCRLGCRAGLDHRSDQQAKDERSTTVNNFVFMTGGVRSLGLQVQMCKYIRNMSDSCTIFVEEGGKYGVGWRGD